MSILIPGWNAEQYVENCVESLINNDYNNFEIILITGGSDKSYDISLNLRKKYPNKVKTLKQEIPQKNKALNIGLKEIDYKSDIIILSDIDCIYQTNWLRRINEIFQDQKYNIITGLYLPFPNQKNSLAEFNNINHGSNLLNFKHEDVVIGNKLCGANAAFRKEIFLKKIGKFDENVPTGDDKVLGITFNKKGEDLYFFSDIFVYTECHSNSLKKFIKRRIRWARDLFITLERRHIFSLIISFNIALFKLFYPIAALIIWGLLFYPSWIHLLLLLSPWLIFYFLYLIKYYRNLKKLSRKVKAQLELHFNHKKAFKIVPILFFAFSIITIISLIYPKRGKWFY
ncbi:MAG: glycosyltransferase [Candidatus Odinarchaeota archaeon]